jgi:PAS domain S-box-containing protein
MHENGNGRGNEMAMRGAAVYRTVVGSIDDYAIFTIDENGILTSWNPGVEALLGYRAQDFIGQHFSMLFPTEDAGAGEADREMSEAREQGRTRDRRWHRRKDGTRFWADGDLFALRDGDRFLGYVKVLRDDGDRRRLDDELAEVRRQQDRFLAMVSHELRTPLMAILSWVRVIEEAEVEPKDLAAAMKIIERNAMVQRDLVEALLDAAQLVAGTLEIDRRDVDLGALVRETIDRHRESAVEKEITLEASIGDAPITIHADEVRVRQIVTNLISNAIKFTLASGAIHIELIPGTSTVDLIVTDSGVGIEPEFLPHLFERFRRAASTGPLAETGVGLGLSIVRELVELHGGTITATSDGVGRGARFVVRLPRR